MVGRIAQLPSAGWFAGAVSPPAGLRLEGLVAWLAGWEPPRGWLASRLGFDAARYRRIPLVQTPDCELLLLAWLPGQATPIHAHGGSVGAVRLLVGTLEERRYGPTEAGYIERSRIRHRAPALLREGRSSVHRVEAIGPGPAVSLHLYAPPLPLLPG
jgi:cysteine dioxygenase